jgi:hypothetical protein
MEETKEYIFFWDAHHAVVLASLASHAGATDISDPAYLIDSSIL